MAKNITRPHIKIKFQQGERKKHGKNGATMQDVVDVLISRLEYYQRGMYKNKDNELALMYLQEAKNALIERGRVYDD